MNKSTYALRGLAIFGALAAAPAALAQRTADQVLMPDDPDQRALLEKWGFSQAIVVGDTVYLSGVVARPRPGETDQRLAFDRAFRTIATILARAGVGWDDVVDMTTFHTDLPGQLDAFVEVKSRYVKAPFPAWTAIDVDRLVSDIAIVEIKVVARKRT